jgi:hypothetical protein
MDELKSTWRALLENPVSAQVTKEGEAYLQRHFSTPNAEGAALAAEAAQGLDDEDTIRQSCAALASELLKRDQEAGGRS